MTYVDAMDWRRAEKAAAKLWKQLEQSTPSPDVWMSGYGAVLRNERLVIEIGVLPQYAQGILSLALSHVPKSIDGFPVVIVERKPAVPYGGEP